MIGSSLPKKQRKFLYNAPMHIRHKFISVPLSRELRDKFGIRSMPLRTGDKVMVRKGSFKGKTGKVSEVDLKRLFVKVEGITRKKADGTEIPVKFRPWNLVITDLNLKDDRRKNIIARKGGRTEVIVEEEEAKEAGKSKEVEERTEEPQVSEEVKTVGEHGGQ
ncbi:MAG: 50S ribosomal protein L24 [Caldisphaeraceae archaeon]|nr:50S ribosomal protein L24 [Caldisphaeraceae archaeon]